MGVVDALQAGFGLWARHWRQLALVSFVLSGITTVLTALVDPGPSLREVIEIARTGLVPEGYEQPSGFAQGMSLLSSFVLLPIEIAALGRIVLGAAVGSTPSTRTAILYGLRRIGSTWWLGIAVLLLFLGLFIPTLILAVALADRWAPLAFIVVLIPSVYVGVRLVPVLGAFVVDDSRGFAAIGRSWALTTRRWWATAGTVLLVGLISAAIGLLTLLPLLVLPGSGRPVAVAQALVGALSSSVFTPITYAVVAVVYLDLRTRREATTAGGVRASIERHDPP